MNVVEYFHELLVIINQNHQNNKSPSILRSRHLKRFTTKNKKVRNSFLFCAPIFGCNLMFCCLFPFESVMNSFGVFARCKTTKLRTGRSQRMAKIQNIPECMFSLAKTSSWLGNLHVRSLLPGNAQFFKTKDLSIGFV
jgi:hypothetical protein